MASAPFTGASAPRAALLLLLAGCACLAMVPGLASAATSAALAASAPAQVGTAGVGNERRWPRAMSSYEYVEGGGPRANAGAAADDALCAAASPSLVFSL